MMHSLAKDTRKFSGKMNFAYILILITFFGVFDVAYSLLPENVMNIAPPTKKIDVIDAPLLTQRIGRNRTKIVDISGRGDFNTVQAAIDDVPEGNSQWIIIHVRKGVYRERVCIPPNKPYIFLRGSGYGRTAIVSSQSSVNNHMSASFVVESPNFIAFGISFKNEAPTGFAHTSQNQSVAALVGADHVAFYQCGFFSTHNTLFDYKGRHYYDNCYIQGSVDIIFGRGQSRFHNCHIFVIADRRTEVHGSITAHTRHSTEENSGFVFVKGKIYGMRDVHLGRPRGPFSRVVFANTYLSNAIAPQGWTNWSHEGSTETLHHAEYKCHGPGSSFKGRAPWAKQLNDKEAAPFLSIDFIDGKQWLPAWM